MYESVVVKYRINVRTIWGDNVEHAPLYFTQVETLITLIFG